MSSPICEKCNAMMVKRQNRKTKSYFWGCGRFPQCRFTMNIVAGRMYSAGLSGTPIPEVSKESEDKMATFEMGKWYVVRKPQKKSHLKVKVRGGKLCWTPEMDKMDGLVTTPKKIHTDKSTAWMRDGHTISFHHKWVDGPFDSKQQALQSKIQVAPRERNIEEEILEFENGAIKFYDKAICKKIDAESVHLEDPDTGIVAIVPKRQFEHQEIVQMRKGFSEKLNKVVKNHWKDGSPLTEEDRNKVRDLQKKINEKKANRPDAEVLEEIKNDIKAWIKAQSKEEQEKTHSPSVKQVVENKHDKYERDIDQIFQDYHDRNRRRKELNERLDKELGRNKPKRNWKNPLILGGCLTAIAGSAYVLAPYAVGLLALL